MALESSRIQPPLPPPPGMLFGYFLDFFFLKQRIEVIQDTAIVEWMLLMQPGLLSNKKGEVREKLFWRSQQPKLLFRSQLAIMEEVTSYLLLSLCRLPVWVSLLLLLVMLQ